MVPKAPKLLDCQQHGDSSELFVVEGDSAARAIDRVRDPHFQAILPMRGKPMNGMKVGLEQLLKNAQFSALISAIGIHPVEIQPDAKPRFEAMRYERVVLLFDPDADGIHSRTLLLLFFYRWMRPLLEAGRVYDAFAPLWAITARQLAKPAFAFTQMQLDRIRERLAAEGIKRPKTIRFRGLSSVGAEILSELCVDPKTRRLSSLAPVDAERALALFEQMKQI